MRTITAKYDGRCKSCFEDITAGDEIGYTGDPHCLRCVAMLDSLSARAKDALAADDDLKAVIAIGYLEGDGPDSHIFEIKDESDLYPDPGHPARSATQSFARGRDFGNVGVRGGPQRFGLFASAIRQS